MEPTNEQLDATKTAHVLVELFRSDFEDEQFTLPKTAWPVLTARIAAALAEASTPRHAAELLRRCDEQDKQWGGAEHDDSHDELDWESFIQKQIDQARMSDSSNGWRDRMVDIGALALAAIKWADRKDEQQK